MPKTKTPRKPSPQRFLAEIESGNSDLVERLLAQGADLHGAWREGPSVCAVRNGHTATVVLLIRHVYWRQQDVLKFLAATVFAPDLWRGKTFLDLQKEADLIDRNIQNNLPNDIEEAFRAARLALFDAAMTCWERIRPDPPKINISDVPAKGKAL